MIAANLLIGIRILGLAAVAAPLLSSAQDVQDAPTSRPLLGDRNFHSEAVENLLKKVKSGIADPETARTFENCFPNTIDTTIHYSEENGLPDTYIITGDIDAMWLRDSSAQVNHYIPLAKNDEKLAKLINGLIRRQSRYILKDPYANAFYREDDKVGQWASDLTDMKPGVYERKWELDSLTYCIRLAYQYWKSTGDASAFDQIWLDAMQLAVDTMKVQQRKDGKGPYHFMRKTEWQTDTVPGAGFGNPVKPNGMICSTFRNSDDAATYLFNIPENLMAVVNLRHLAEMLDALGKKPALAKDALALADEVEEAIKNHGIVKHPKYGEIYAYEADGFGNVLLMDDAGLPSLVAIPYMGYGEIHDPVYQNTRRFALSKDNPFFYKGKAAEGTGSPHLARAGDNLIWPMGISSRGLTSKDPVEIAKCIGMLVTNTGGTGFMHEGFHMDGGANYTRPWFAWSNSLFGELIVYAYENFPEALSPAAK